MKQLIDESIDNFLIKTSSGFNLSMTLGSVRTGGSCQAVSVL